MPDWIGRDLDKVHIDELIARGGMAEVYLGRHISLDRKVAVKVMRGHVDQDLDAVSRFEREARVVAGLHHPNIVQVYDYELLDGQPCLIMEYVPGPSLSTYLKALHARGEKLPLSTIAHILNSLADALDYAHSRNIVHRDIKPGNVLLRSPGRPIDIDLPLPADAEPILTDFGLVRLLDSSIHTATGTVSGTPSYMSPEQARGDPVGPFTDIYALGVMLYEMLAGGVPFEADSTFGVLMKHLNDPPPPIFGISHDLQTIIDRALAKDPSHRYPTAKEMAREFQAVFNGETISFDTIKQAELARKSIPAASRRRKAQFDWVWAGIGALLMIGLVFASFRIFSGTSPAPPTDQIVGRVSYIDFNYVMDKAVISLNLPTPAKGSHYEVWFMAGGGEIRRNVGIVEMQASGQGQLVFIDPAAENVLEMFDQIEVTREPDNDPKPDESSGDVAASFIYPPLALVHLRHVLARFESAPEESALIQGLWFGADAIDTSAIELKEAYAKKDEALVRKKTEEIINQLVGKADTARFRDWDGDGTIDNPGDGFGMLGDGYIAMTESHTKFAMQAPDATENIRSHGEFVLVSLQNIQGWSEQLLEKALQLQEMPFGPEMEPLISEMAALAKSAVSGTDSNGNSIIEPIPGEGGADTAYEQAYFMGEMQLLPGANRIPPPAAAP